MLGKLRAIRWGKLKKLKSKKVKVRKQFLTFTFFQIFLLRLFRFQQNIINLFCRSFLMKRQNCFVFGKFLAQNFKCDLFDFS